MPFKRSFPQVRTWEFKYESKIKANVRFAVVCVAIWMLSSQLVEFLSIQHVFFEENRFVAMLISLIVGLPVAAYLYYGILPPRYPTMTGICVTDSEGNPRIILSTDKHGGVINILDNEGNVVNTLSATD